MINQLASFYFLALYIPFIWIFIAYARGAYLYPEVRPACLHVLVVSVITCLLMLFQYEAYEIIGRNVFPFWVLLFPVIQLFSRDVKIRQAPHRKILFFESTPDTSSVSRETPLYMLRGAQLFMLMLVASVTLFVSGMFLVPCERLDVFLSLSGCRATIVVGVESVGPSYLSFAPNSQLFAVMVDRGTMIVGDAKTHTVLRSLQTDTDILAHAWSSDSESIAIGMRSGTVSIFDVNTGKLRRTFAYDIGKTMSLAFITNTSRLLITGENRPGVVWDSKTDRLVATLPFPNTSIHNAVSSPSGQWIAVGVGEHVYLYDTERWGIQEVILPGVYVGAWFRDDDKLATYYRNTLYYHLKSSNGVWQTTEFLDDYSHELMKPSFASDGRPLLLRGYFSNKLQRDIVRVYDVANDRIVFERQYKIFSFEDVEISPDAQMIGVLRTKPAEEMVLELWDFRIN